MDLSLEEQEDIVKGIAQRYFYNIFNGMMYSPVAVNHTVDFEPETQTWLAIFTRRLSKQEQNGVGIRIPAPTILAEYNHYFKREGKPTQEVLERLVKAYAAAYIRDNGGYDALARSRGRAELVHIITLEEAKD